MILNQENHEEKNLFFPSLIQRQNKVNFVIIPDIFHFVYTDSIFKSQILHPERVKCAFFAFNLKQFDWNSLSQDIRMAQRRRLNACNSLSVTMSLC